MKIKCEYCDNASFIGDELICCITNEDVYTQDNCDNFSIERYKKYCGNMEKDIEND